MVTMVATFEQSPNIRSTGASPTIASIITNASEPVFLPKAAARMKRLRALCEAQAPEPLRKRGLYAPPDFLTFA
jgi:hypothetical protein